MAPQVGLVPVVLAFVAGISVFAGACHLLVAARGTSRQIHLSFSLLCVLAATWAVFGILKYTAAEPDVFVAATRSRVLLGHLIGATSVWFFASYGRERFGPLLWSLVVVQLVFAVLNEVSPYGLYYSGPPQLELLRLPWGERITVAGGPYGWGYRLVPFAVLLPLAIGGWATARLHEKGRGREARALGLALVVLVLVAIGSFTTWTTPFPFTDLAFLGVIAIVTLSTAGDVIEVGGVRQALRETRQRLGAMVESAPEAIVLLDGETARAVVANSQALALYGISHDTIPSFAPAEAAPPEQAEGEPSAVMFNRGWLNALAGRRPRFPWTVRSTSGEDIPCDALLVRLPGAKRPMVRLSLVDLRDLEAAEARGASLEEQLRQSQKLEAVGRLTGGIAHDFNNFLTVMQGSLELLREGDLAPGEAEELMGEALAAAERSRELTRHLLAFSRRQPLAPRPVRLDEAVERTCTLLRRTLGAHICIRNDAPAEVWPVEVDPSLLESALVNLAINAADAMPDGGSIVVGARNVRLEQRDYEFRDRLSPGPYVRVHVSDSGHGIDEAMLDRVIEPFFTTKEVGKGTGLGLSMAYGFATQSGGTLRIESERGVGTTVHLYFPRLEEARGKRPTEGAAATSKGAR